MKLIFIITLLLSLLTLTLGYTEISAIRMAAYSAAAYSDNPQACVPESSFKVIATLNVTYGDFKIFGFVGYAGAIATIAFRGSDGISHVLAQARESDGVSYPGIENAQVLEYYYNTAMLLQPQLIASFSLLPSVSSIYMTGHSYGGALASLLLLDVRNYYSSQTIYLYTFGQPRVGNYYLSQAIHEAAKGNTYRVVNFNDAVPHLPPCSQDETGACTIIETFSKEQYDIEELEGVVWFIGAPYHFPSEIYYQHGMIEYEICTGAPEGEDESCSNSLSPKSYGLAPHATYFGMDMSAVCEEMGSCKPPEVISCGNSTGTCCAYDEPLCCGDTCCEHSNTCCTYEDRGICCDAGEACCGSYCCDVNNGFNCCGGLCTYSSEPCECCGTSCCQQGYGCCPTTNWDYCCVPGGDCCEWGCAREGYNCCPSQEFYGYSCPEGTFCCKITNPYPVEKVICCETGTTCGTYECEGGKQEISGDFDENITRMKIFG